MWIPKKTYEKNGNPQGHTFGRDWGPEIVPPERVALRVLKLCRYSGGTNYFPAGRFSDHNNRPAGTCGLAVFEFRREEFGSECQILIFLKKIQNLAFGAKFVPPEFKNFKATLSGWTIFGAPKSSRRNVWPCWF